MFIFILFYFLFSEETRRKKINKRYEEVDGVRKEKERLTTDCLSYTINIFPYSLCIGGTGKYEPEEMYLGCIIEWFLGCG